MVDRLFVLFNDCDLRKTGLFLNINLIWQYQANPIREYIFARFKALLKRLF